MIVVNLNNCDSGQLKEMGTCCVEVEGTERCRETCAARDWEITKERIRAQERECAPVHRCCWGVQDQLLPLATVNSGQ